MVEQVFPLPKGWVTVPVYNPVYDRGDSVWCAATIPEKDHAPPREGTVGDSALAQRDGA